MALPNNGGMRWRSDRPLVSIVILNADRSEVLGTAIESALDQTYENVEVVVVDDGSIDDSLDVARGFGERLRLVPLLRSGRCRSLQMGFESARGELIAVLEADAQFAPTKIERVVQRFVADVNLVAVSNGGGVTADDGRVVALPRPRLATGRVDRTLLAHGRYAHAPLSGMTFPRHLLEEVLPVEIRHGVDDPALYLAIAAGFRGRVDAVREPLTRYPHALRATGEERIDQRRRERRVTVEEIGRWARSTGRSHALHDDAELICLDAKAGEAIPMARRLYALRRSIGEVVATRTSPGQAFAVLRSRAAMLL